MGQFFTTPAFIAFETTTIFIIIDYIKENVFQYAFINSSIVQNIFVEFLCILYCNDSMRKFILYNGHYRASMCCICLMSQ